MRTNNGTATPTPSSAPPQTQPAPLSPRVIHDDAVHPLGEWGVILGLPKHTLKREARLARLRVAKRAGKLWATGAWIRQWIASGEVKRPRPTANPAEGANS